MKTKPKKPQKKRASKYEKKLKIEGSFEQAIRVLVREPEEDKV
jgi:hypothetical protein